MISGKDKGKQGKVLKVDRKLNRVLVDGCELRNLEIWVTTTYRGNTTFVEPMSRLEASLKRSRSFLTRTCSSWTPSPSRFREGVVSCRKPTKVKINKVDGVRQRVSLSSGKVIPKPQESMQRSHPSLRPSDPRILPLVMYLLAPRVISRFLR